jgi:hypothetical protein
MLIRALYHLYHEGDLPGSIYHHAVLEPLVRLWEMYLLADRSGFLLAEPHFEADRSHLREHFVQRLV